MYWNYCATLGYLKLHSYGALKCTDNVMVIGAQSEIGGLIPDLGIICCVHFRIKALGKDINISLSPQAMGYISG